VPELPAPVRCDDQLAVFDDVLDPQELAEVRNEFDTASFRSVHAFGLRRVWRLHDVSR
jgi:hypothetical protein